MAERDARTIVILGANYMEPGAPPRPLDVVIVKGRVESLRPRVLSDETRRMAQKPGTWAIDGTGAFLAPGFTDMHAHLRDFDESHKETIESGAQAAAAGGFTRVVAMANTSPPLDTVAAVRVFVDKAKGVPVKVMPVAAVTRGLEGRELTDFEALADAGAVAFSDDGRNAYDQDLAIAALKRAAAVGRPVLVHAQDQDAADGQADPSVAKRAGVKPWPCRAEADAVQRAVEACRITGGRVHIQHVSCAASVEVIRKAKADGLPVTAEVTPHHLTLTADRVVSGDGKPDPMAKVNPPLRPADDRRALVRALADGVIDAVATDHAPHDAASKGGNFAAASFGISGLETALALCLRLVETNQLTLRRLVESLTLGPWHCLGEATGLPRPAIREDQPADLVLFDNKGIWTVDAHELVSKGGNTPLLGEELQGRVLLTMANGHPVISRWFAGTA